MATAVGSFAFSAIESGLNGRATTTLTHRERNPADQHGVRWNSQYRRAASCGLNGGLRRSLVPVVTDRPTGRDADPLATRLRRTAADADTTFEAATAELVRLDLVEHRERTRWMDRIDLEAATLDGTLIDLAERHVTVSVRTVSGRIVQGQVESVGVDHLVVGASGRPRTLVHRGAIVAVVVAQSEAGPARGDRTATAATFASTLAELSATRPRVNIGVAGAPELAAGSLWSCGIDLCTVRSDGQDGRWIHVPLTHISEVMLLDC